MLEKIKNIIGKNKKVFLFGVILLVFFYFLGDVAFAQDSATAETKDTKTQIVEFINFVLQVIAVLLALLTYLSTMFLSPEWINGSIFGMNNYFQNIWILVSNIVYFIFAFILIGIAFMNIIGVGKDKFQLKQALPKFIVGILIVPFSWFIVQFVLSISAVLTISAVNLPSQTFNSYKTTMNNVQIPKSCYLDLSKDGEINNEKPEESWFYCDKKEGGKVGFGTLLDENKSSSGIFGTIGIYTYGILGLDNTSKINKLAVKDIKNLSDLVVKVVFDVLFVLIYSILMIGLGLVLMVRGIRIWLYMMFSPVFGLMFFFDKSSGGGSGFFEKFNIKEFISLAMVPVYAMLALSFGLLFMFVVAQGMTDKYKGSIGDTLVDVGSSPDGSIISVGGKIEDTNSLKLTIKGAVSNPDNITNFFKEAGGSALGLIGSLVLKLFGIVVLWGAMMSALKSSKITGAVIEPLAQFGDQVGKIAQKSPSYLPIFGGQSMQSLQRTSSKAQGVFDTMASTQSKSLTEKIPFFSGAEFASSMQDLTNEMKRAGKAEDVRKLFERFRTLPNMTRDRFRDGINQLNEALKQNTSGKQNLALDEIKTSTIGETVDSLNKLNKKIRDDGGGVIGNIQQFTSSNLYNSSSTDEADKSKKEGDTAKTDDKTTQIQVGTQNINVQREAATDGSEGKITGIDTTKEANITNLLNGLKISFSGNEIKTKKSEFIETLRENSNFDGLTEQELQGIADAIDNTSYYFHSEN